MGAAAGKKPTDEEDSSVASFNNQHLQSFPTELTQSLCHHLTSLTLDVNNIQVLVGEELQMLSRLQKLSICYNDLKGKLPQQLALLPLVSIQMYDNKIEELPDNIGELCSTLTTLSLQRNSLQTLPSSFSSLTRLSKLYLEFNLFSSFPSPILSLPSLTELNLSGHSSIDSIPLQVSQLQRLKKLEINHLTLTQLPVELFSLPELEYLDVSINRLKGLPEGFAEMAGQGKLNHLNVGYNEIEVFPAELLKITTLRYLDLRGNTTDFTEAPELVGFKGTKRTDTPLPSQILDNLFLGGLSATQSKSVLNKLGITHVLSVCYEKVIHFEGITYKQIELTDDSSEDIKQHFSTTNAFIHDCIAGKGGGDGGGGGGVSGRVLVNCNRGISRSGTVVIAYIMWSTGRTFQDAIEFVVSKRDVVFPNPSFTKQLELYETELIGVEKNKENNNNNTNDDK